MNDPDQTRQQLAAFGAAYDYDASYMTALLDASAEGFATFAAAQPMSVFREALPLDAHFVARVATMMGDDCGPCAQLNLRMAAEAGVSRELLGQVIESPEDLPPALADVHAHALGVTRAEGPDLERVERLRARYGDAGMAELALAITGSRIYPTMKKALGQPGYCERLSLDF